MNSKITALIAVFIAFTVLPFVSMYYAILHQTSVSVIPELVYPIFIIPTIFLAFYMERQLKNNLDQETKHLIIVFFGICIGLYAAFLLLMTWSRYENFVSEAIDVHFFEQVMWQLSEFKMPYIWGLNQQGFAPIAQHFSPIFIFLVPFFWISRTGGMLMFVQAIGAISAAIPIYFIGKYYLKSRGIGLALSFAYLSFGGLQFGFAYGFHEILFFPVLFLWAYYFYLHKKTYLYFLFIFLSLMVKEEVSFIVIFWAIYLFVVRRDKIMGLVTGGLGILWYLLCFNIIFPYFNKGTGFGYWGQYSTVGNGGLLGLIESIVLKPFNFLSSLVTPELKVQTFLQTFGQFGFLLFLFPPAILIIFPSLMEKLLSSNIAMANGAHYSTAVAAVTVVATFEALPRIYNYKFVKKYVHNKNIFFTVLIFYFALFSNAFFGYRGYSLIPLVHTSIQETPITDENRQQLTQILSAIPDKATVSSQYQITPHLNKHYTKATTWPGMAGAEDFVIIDTQLPPVMGATSQQYNDYIDKLNKNPNYQVAINNLGVVVYRRKTFNLQGL